MKSNDVNYSYCLVQKEILVINKLLICIRIDKISLKETQMTNDHGTNENNIDRMAGMTNKILKMFPSKWAI